MKNTHARPVQRNTKHKSENTVELFAGIPTPLIYTKEETSCENAVKKVWVCFILKRT